MLDELLTEKKDIDPDLIDVDNYPDVPELATRDDLVALHREIAQHGSRRKGEVPVAGAEIIADLAEIVDHSSTSSLDAYAAKMKAVQKAVEHVIAALRCNNAGEQSDARQELNAAQTWMAHARLVR